MVNKCKLIRVHHEYNYDDDFYRAIITDDSDWLELSNEQIALLEDRRVRAKIMEKNNNYYDHLVFIKDRTSELKNILESGLEEIKAQIKEENELKEKKEKARLAKAEKAKKEKEKKQKEKAEQARLKEIEQAKKLLKEIGEL